MSDSGIGAHDLQSGTFEMERRLRAPGFVGVNFVNPVRARGPFTLVTGMTLEGGLGTAISSESTIFNGDCSP
jgi:hypothetical protein